MKTKHYLAMTMMLILLSGCSSNLNPLNWFGNNNDETTIDPIAAENERRPVVAEITALALERTPGGAVIRASALPPTQGWFAAELVSADPDGEPINGVLSFAFRAVPPPEAARQSAPQSRVLTAAVVVTSDTLANTRVIQVSGSQNSRSVRP